MEITLDILKDKLKLIKKLGYVKSHRKGNTGIGKTLEDLLGIKENNIPLCDIHKLAELKAYRKDATSMLTLFTLEPEPKGGDRDRFLLDNFGYSKRKNKRSKELHVSVCCKRCNPQGLKLIPSKNKIFLGTENEKLHTFWDTEKLRKKFDKKLPALIYVLADRKTSKKIEYFHYNEAYFLSGFNFSKFKRMVKKDYIVADLRMYYRPNGSVRNHGTGFRVKINKLYDCFRNKERLI